MGGPFTQRFAGLGAKVAFCDVSEERGAPTSKELDVPGIVADVPSEEAVNTGEETARGPMIR